MYPDQAEPIAKVVSGMTVVDSDGAEVGKVETVKMGDPAAVTTEGQDPGEDRDMVNAVAESVFGDEPRVTVQEAARLLRIGRNTCYESVREQRIPAVRVGRRLLIPRARLPQWIEASTTAPASEVLSSGHSPQV